MSEGLQTSTTDRVNGAFPFVAPIVPARQTAVRSVRIGLLGYGRIGQAVAAAAEAEQERLEACGLSLTFVRALVRDLTKPRSAPAIR